MENSRERGASGFVVAASHFTKSPPITAPRINAPTGKHCFFMIHLLSFCIQNLTNE